MRHHCCCSLWGRSSPFLPYSCHCHPLVSPTQGWGQTPQNRFWKYFGISYLSNMKTGNTFNGKSILVVGTACREILTEPSHLVHVFLLLRFKPSHQYDFSSFSKSAGRLEGIDIHHLFCLAIIFRNPYHQISRWKKIYQLHLFSSTLKSAQTTMLHCLACHQLQVTGTEVFSHDISHTRLFQTWIT